MIVTSKSWNFFHDFTNLNILSSLKALKADIELFPLPPDPDSDNESIRSIELRRTIIQSKMLNLSLT
jgi:hypothetical protein